MKPTKKLLQRAFLTACMVYTVVTLVNGCATPNPNAGQPVINPTTGLPVTTTNAATGAVTTNVQPPYIANAGVTAAVGTISALNTATAPLNPYSGVISLALGLTTIIAGGVAAWKNNQANGLNSQLTAVVQGVEAATTDATTGANVSAVSGAAVKAAIQSHATAAGVQPALAAKVLKVTGS